MAEVEGTFDERFGAVRDAFAASLDNEDVGASVAVDVGGELVVDLWGGYADEARTVPWGQDTIVNVWSSTKPMAALCVLVLADRGELDLDAPVARYWPEFAAEDKGGVLVRHVLSHTSGLPSWTEPTTVQELYDWDLVTGRLAAQRARAEPGTEACYHSVTQGYLVGELVRRVTGRTCGEFFAEELAGPLGADFHIGLAAEHDHRVAPVIPPPETAPWTNDAGIEPNPLVPPEVANTPEWRRAEIPSAGGHGNARSMARVQSVLACGGEVRGVRLLSEAGCRRVREVQYEGLDLVLGTTVRWGLGYGVNGATCSWGGWGGSMVLVDLDARMTVAFAMNQMLDKGSLGDERALGLVMAAYGALAEQ
ncbi:serine hydrolase domain-containing protein [Umezawaea tangerina]|uniref:CubicO group peptidase (Beta-lactamase class C family) n=1 Tax=Umezawaea tangerina TaxID=84725 RepID=A0A2T0TDY4_9PSEU|nr:serine hydrolase domain-containing protein [Umezawaea tangerina]PRY43870.1 CubicO group peptidase (beta-lactamase class C family) [Umezawaea tangerina]